MDNDSRVCIAREGHLRLCSHQLITWSDVEQYLLALYSRGGDKTETFELIGCRHPVHQGCPDENRSAEASDADTYPSIELEFNPLLGEASLRLIWSAHATLPVNQDGRFES